MSVTKIKEILDIKQQVITNGMVFMSSLNELTDFMDIKKKSHISKTKNRYADKFQSK